MCRGRVTSVMSTRTEREREIKVKQKLGTLMEVAWYHESVLLFRLIPTEGAVYI